MQKAILALIITSLVFLSAFLLSDELQEQQTIDISGVRADLSLTLLDRQVQSDLLTTANCSNNDQLYNQLSELSARIQYIEGQRGWEDAEVQQLKKEYSLALIQDYLRTISQNDNCTVSTSYIVAFSQHDGCTDCEAAWEVLAEYEQTFPETKVYIIDTGVPLQSIDTLQAEWDAPESGLTLVKDGDITAITMIEDLITEARIAAETEESDTIDTQVE